MLKDANIYYDINKTKHKGQKYFLKAEVNREVDSYYIFCYKSKKKKSSFCTIAQASDSEFSQDNKLLLKDLLFEKEKYSVGDGVEGVSAEFDMERIFNYTNNVSQKNFKKLKLSANDQFLFKNIKYRINEDGCVCLCPDQYRDLNVIESSLFETMLLNPTEIKVAAWRPLLNKLPKKFLYFQARIRLQFCKGDHYYYIDSKQNNECMKRTYCEDLIDSYLMNDNNYYQTYELAAKSVIR